jgi:hypothetical protein
MTSVRPYTAFQHITQRQGAAQSTATLRTITVTSVPRYPAFKLPERRFDAPGDATLHKRSRPSLPVRAPPSHGTHAPTTGGEQFGRHARCQEECPPEPRPPQNQVGQVHGMGPSDP